MSPDDHLSGISTMWTLLKDAHSGIPSAADAAKELLLARYGEAVRRYLLSLLRDPHAADDLTQEFAIRVLSGGFHAADPSKGRFRNYVKTTLFHLVGAYLRSNGPDRFPTMNCCLLNLRGPCNIGEKFRFGMAFGVVDSCLGGLGGSECELLHGATGTGRPPAHCLG